MEEKTLSRPPWLFTASTLGLVVGMVELLLIDFGPPRLFRAVAIADASTGWVPLLAALQGIRAVPWPPHPGYVLLWVLLTLRWILVLLVALFVLVALAV